MDSLCRLCCSKSTNLTSIFSFKNERLLSDIILLICPIRIDASDYLSKFICDQCLNRLLDALNLREMSVKSDIYLKQLEFPPEIPVISNLDLQNLPQMSYEDQNGFESNENLAMSEDFDEESIIPFAPSTKKKAKNHKCPFCPATYSIVGFVKRHIATMHGGDPPKKKRKTSGESVKKKSGEQFKII